MAKALLTTPKGTAKYPWLNKADDKFGDPKYKTELVVNSADTTDLTAKLEDLLEDYYQSVLEREGQGGKFAEIFKDEMPYYEEDGNVIFKASLNKNGKKKSTGEEWENKVSFYDAGGRFIPEGKRPVVGGGSTIRISFEPNLWTIPETEGRGNSKKTNLKVGISMRLKGIQVISAQQGGSERSASDMGFGAEEGGFQYDPDAFDTDSAADGSFESDAANF